MSEICPCFIRIQFPLIYLQSIAFEAPLVHAGIAAVYLPQQEGPPSHFSSLPQQVFPVGPVGILGSAAADIFFSSFAPPHCAHSTASPGEFPTVMISVVEPQSAHWYS